MAIRKRRSQVVLSGAETAALAARSLATAVRDGEHFLALAEADLAACTNPAMVGWWEAQVAAARASLAQHRAALAAA